MGNFKQSKQFLTCLLTVINYFKANQQWSNQCFTLETFTDWKIVQEVILATFSYNIWKCEYQGTIFFFSLTFNLFIFIINLFIFILIRRFSCLFYQTQKTMINSKRRKSIIKRLSSCWCFKRTSIRPIYW